MKELTRIITVQITLIEQMPEHDADTIIASKEEAQENMEYTFELDEHYYNLAKKRLDAEMAQMNLFDFGFNPYQE